MDPGSDRTVALMAIRPRFADLILAGIKRVEFRKTPFRIPISHVLIYSSGPVGRIVGFFEVDGLDEGELDYLWDRYFDVAGVQAADLSTYYGERRRGVAIHIGRVFKLEDPLPLAFVCEGCQAPQSFRYLSRTVLDALESYVAGHEAGSTFQQHAGD